MKKRLMRKKLNEAMREVAVLRYRVEHPIVDVRIRLSDGRAHCAHDFKFEVYDTKNKGDIRIPVEEALSHMLRAHGEQLELYVANLEKSYMKVLGEFAKCDARPMMITLRDGDFVLPVAQAEVRQ